MARSKLLPVQHPSGLTFYFAREKLDESKLHIELQGSSIEQAIETYVTATLTIRNDEHLSIAKLQ